MRSSRFLSALSISTILGVITAPVATQAGAGIIRDPAPSAAFSNVSPWGIHCYEYASTPSGVITCALTDGSPMAGVFVTIGHYDLTSETFTRTNEAAALNSPTAMNVNLTLEPGLGRYAVFVRGGQAGPTDVWFASRAAAGTAFGAPVRISGLAATPEVFALGYVDGKLKLFFPDGPFATSGPDKIVMQDFDVSNLAAPALVGQKQTVASLTASGIVVFDVSTINGPGGEVQGLIITEVMLNGPDTRPTLVLKADLDPSHPATRLAVLPPNCGSGPCAAMRGSLAGGRCLFNGSWNGPPVMHDMAAAWILGDRAKIGGNADVFGAVVSSMGVADTFVFLSIGEAPAVQMPYLGVGAFGLDASLVIYAGKMAHAPNQRGQLSIPVPNRMGLIGGRVAVQGLSFDPNAGTYALTNTSWITIN